MPGTLVSRYSFTDTPWSIASPACSASSSRGRTPTPITTRSAARRVPSSSDDGVGLDALRLASEMERDAVRFVQRLNESAEVVAEHAGERKVFGRDDVDVDVARAQRRRHLEADEARRR